MAYKGLLHLSESKLFHKMDPLSMDPLSLPFSFMSGVTLVILKEPPFKTSLFSSSLLPLQTGFYSVVDVEKNTDAFHNVQQWQETGKKAYKR
eukprot:1137875-Pelagomonas_calceolata.AAC.2